MGKRILLAWELGNGAGHLLILGRIADALRRRGHEPVFALQRTGGVKAAGEAFEGCELHSAPLWPDLGRRASGPSPRPAVSLGESLGRVGMRTRAGVDAMLLAWDRLLAAVAPDAVVADFAPACLMACRGRIPTVAVGDGYTVPPVHLECFPNFDPDRLPPLIEESDTLQAVNDSLRASGRAALSRLPEIFTADRYCPGSFRELDPYAESRHEPAVAPWMPAWDRSRTAEGDEIFGYFSVTSPVQPVIFTALARLAESGIRVRVHASNLDTEYVSWLEAAGVVVEPEPVPFGRIHARSRLVVSHGSAGFASCALTAGIPHIVIPVNLPTHLTGEALERLGTGRAVRLRMNSPLEAVLLQQVVLESYGDTGMLNVARRLAPDFARRSEPRPADVAADLVGELI